MSTRRDDLRARLHRARDDLRARLRRARTFWWVVPAFLGGFLTWVTFYVAGVRLHRRELILAGAAYSAFSAMLLFAITREAIDQSDTASTLASAGLVIAWLGGAAHACSVAQAFEHELTAGPSRRGGFPRPGGRRRRGAPPAQGGSTAPGSAFGAGSGEFFSANRPPEVIEPIEANTASEKELARLPGATPELVERWLAERTRRGGFRDLAELTRALDLTPHQVVRIRTRVSFEDPGEQPVRGGGGRVLDV